MGTALSDGDSDGVFVDIQAEVEFNTLQGVVVCLHIHMMNQNAYLAQDEDVLAALPIRATRAKMNGNHTAFSTQRPRTPVRAVSHKV